MKPLTIPTHLQLRKEPKQKRTHDLLIKIMGSTSALIQEKGYLALNTNAIAQHAGIDVKSLYEFFPNKESILYRIADQWLASMRELLITFHEPKYLELPWRQYYQTIQNECLSLESYQNNYISLQGLWEVIPEFEHLDKYHQQFITEFSLNDLKRFGAKGSDEDLRIVTMFILIVEDAIGSSISSLNKKELKKMWALQMETTIFHLSKFLD